MIWSVTTSAANGWYVGESLLQPNTDPGDDEYFDLQFDERGGNGWDDYTTLAGDMDGKNGTDLLFVALDRNPIPAHRVLSDGNGSFTAVTSVKLQTSAKSSIVRLADVSGEGRSDIVAFDQSNSKLRVSLGTSDGSFDFSRVEQTLPQDEWSQFAFVIGDFNGDGLQDVLWINETRNSRFYIGLAREGDAL